MTAISAMIAKSGTKFWLFYLPMNEESRRRSETKIRKDRTRSRVSIETGRLEFYEELTKKRLVFEDSVLTIPEQKLSPTDSYGQHLLVLDSFWFWKFNLFKNNRSVRPLYLGQDVIKLTGILKLWNIISNLVLKITSKCHFISNCINLPYIPNNNF